MEFSRRFKTMADISPSHDGRPDYNLRRGKRADAPLLTHDASARKADMPASDPTGGPDPAEIRAALAHLLASPSFGKSAQLSNFLRFVVEETLAGRGNRIKAYTIATAALGRDEAFDPQADPIVRVEAARLRRALRTYYADGGAGDAIMIELPTGTYTPVFRSLGQQRRSAITRLREAAHEFAAFTRENRRLLLVVFVIAATVSLTVEILDAWIFNAF